MTVTFKFLIIALVAAIVLAGCARRKHERSKTIESAGVASDTTVWVLYSDTTIRASYNIIEERRGNFVRIAIADDSDREAVVAAVTELARNYGRVDVCRPGFTERGDEYLVFMGDTVIVFEAGSSFTISEWKGL